MKRYEKDVEALAAAVEDSKTALDFIGSTSKSVEEVRTEIESLQKKAYV